MMAGTRGEIWWEARRERREGWHRLAERSTEILSLPCCLERAERSCVERPALSQPKSAEYEVLWARLQGRTEDSGLSIKDQGATG